MARVKRLDWVEYVALSEWIKAHKEGLAEGKRTMTDWAEQANKEAEVGGKVTAESLRNACERLGVNYVSSSPGGWERTQTAVQREINNALAEDRSRMQRIEAALQSIVQDMKAAGGSQRTPTTTRPKYARWRLRSPACVGR